jgi:uncharacterized protein YlxW (UPF0749 family)
MIYDDHGKCSCYSFHLQAPHSSFPQNVAAAAGAQCTMIEKLCWVWTSRVSSILLGLELITSMREKRESGEREREMRSKYVVNMLQKKKKQLQHEATVL